MGVLKIRKDLSWKEGLLAEVKYSFSGGSSYDFIFQLLVP